MGSLLSFASQGQCIQAQHCMVEGRGDNAQSDDGRRVRCPGLLVIHLGRAKSEKADVSSCAVTSDRPGVRPQGPSPITQLAERRKRGREESREKLISGIWVQGDLRFQALQASSFRETHRVDGVAEGGCCCWSASGPATPSCRSGLSHPGRE